MNQLVKAAHKTLCALRANFVPFVVKQKSY